MYQIGELAKRLGLSQATLRFYEREGIIAPAERADNGYRYYNSLHERQLRFVLRGKQAGLSNSDMREMVHLKAHAEESTCREVKDIVDLKLAKVKEKLAELQAFERSLSDLSAACCGSDELATHCAILEALDEFVD
ncbi:Zn(2+)-responsive transcriptional regulator [Aliagarivorans taiwanensis]|uniref:Zn(2+)-responsive transcriptional regulator n=1 Tax=Aliagarivorans taiwanensis TaxID=561966 RepID=UPI0003FFA6DA|nr:Zn(2+)-responsive transcriptional regulator [Aliagarivorans taiwanensis]